MTTTHSDNKQSECENMFQVWFKEWTSNIDVVDPKNEFVYKAAFFQSYAIMKKRLDEAKMKMDVMQGFMNVAFEQRDEAYERIEKLEKALNRINSEKIEDCFKYEIAREALQQSPKTKEG